MTLLAVAEVMDGLAPRLEEQADSVPSGKLLEPRDRATIAPREKVPR